MKTRIKFYKGTYFPQYRSWWCWHPINVSISYSVEYYERYGFKGAYDMSFTKRHYWEDIRNAERAIDKFIQNGYCND